MVHLDGTLWYWDFAVAELMKTIDIKMPIYSMVILALLLGQTEKGVQENGSKVMPAHAFAYLSVENSQVHDNTPKALCGQIRKCNLNESRLAGVILAEVMFTNRKERAELLEALVIDTNYTIYSGGCSYMLVYKKSMLGGSSGDKADEDL